MCHFSLLSGCSVLTQNQVKNINTFAVSAKKYIDFPGEVLKKRAELHLNNELLEASQFSNPVEINRKVMDARNHYKSAIRLSDKFDLSIKLLQKYSVLLAALSAGKYEKELDASTKSLGNSLTEAVELYNASVPDKLPAVIGKQISGIVLLAGSRITKAKQAKALKRYIPAGDMLVQNTIQNLTEVLDSDSFAGANGITFPGLKALLQLEYDNYLANYKNIMFSDTLGISHGSMITYNAGLDTFEKVEMLRKKSVEGARKLLRAHQKLLAEIKSRKNIKELIKETQDLMADVQELNKLLNTFVNKS